MPDTVKYVLDESRIPKAWYNLHADAGQMNLYLNYAREHLLYAGESDPIGIILCSDKDDAVVKYATGDINAKVFASKYLTELPNEDALRAELLTTQAAIARRLEERKSPS